MEGRAAESSQVIPCADKQWLLSQNKIRNVTGMCYFLNYYLILPAKSLQLSAVLTVGLFSNPDYWNSQHWTVSFWRRVTLNILFQDRSQIFLLSEVFKFSLTHILMDYIKKTKRLNRNILVIVAIIILDETKKLWSFIYISHHEVPEATYLAKSWLLCML